MLVLGAGAGLLIAVAVIAVGAWNDRQRQDVRFGGRDYINPIAISGAEARARWFPLRDRDVRRLGMRLLTPVAQSQPGSTSTVVLLQRDDGQYEIYGLSGGP